MLSLQSHHIVDLFCLVDERIPASLPKEKGGRPLLLSSSEIVTILVWNTLVFHEKTLKGLHAKIRMYHSKDFPRFPKYQGFVAACHRNIPTLIAVLQSLMIPCTPIRILDSTKLPVCSIKRADRHRVAKDVAAYGKNHQGWWYGFKLHASIDLKGNLSHIVFTPGNTHDAQMMPKLLNKHARLAVGDSHYGAKVMGRKMWKKYGTIVIAPPHVRQKRKVMTLWQKELLSIRSKIETVFDYLKEHLHIVTSFPRSVNGYLLHYLGVLVGYMVERGF